ncbi:MAG: hypothetical protein H5T97_13825, partial [Firmicutes bacterium]|nr:hypothetical protein [Bacillota bacterium]
MHRRWRVKQRAEVRPSPVGPAMVKLVNPSPPRPIPAYDGAFFTNMVVWMARASLVMWSTCLEC